MDDAHIRKLRKNQVKLIKRLDVGNDLLAFLVGNHALTEEMVERIEVHPVGHRSRASDLLALLPKRGPKAFDIFIEALVETEQEYLAELLDEVLTPKLLKKKKTTTTVHSQETKEPGEVQLVDKNFAENLLKKGGVYKMTAIPRGRAVIINNEMFQDGDIRKGTEYDQKKLKQLFEDLHFEVVTYKDLSAKIIEETLTREKELQKPSANAFVLCILSHGKRDQITGTDRKEIPIEVITSMFDGKSCKTLANKPKIFIFQVCQGVTRTKGQDETDFVTDQMNKVDIDSPDAEPFFPKETKHEKTDMVMAYATVPGYVAIRNIEVGSWFITDLCDTFAKHAWEDDVLHLLNKVCAKMAERRTSEGYYQASQFVSSLTKDLFFFPGYSTNSTPVGSASIQATDT